MALALILSRVSRLRPARNGSPQELDDEVVVANVVPERVRMKDEDSELDVVEDPLGVEVPEVAPPNAR